MQNKINIGIIGRNFGYHVIYKASLKNKKYKIRGFSFKSKKGNKIKIPKNVKIYKSWKKLILDRKINGVIIATPPFLHKNMISFAIKNNKHIFCEKPFTTSYKEANFICDSVRKKKNLSHMVNYEFAEIDAFNFFKKKIINRIKINKINLDWFINLNLNKGSRKSWKEDHSMGGGIIFNYICHAIYYLEFLFGKIKAIKTNIFLEKKNNSKSLKGIIFFNNGLSVNLNVKAGAIKNKIKPLHQLTISSDKENYILGTNLNSLADKFFLKTFNKNPKKIVKVLFDSEKNKNDFRIKPTEKNLKKFETSISKGYAQKPNFFDAKRIHLIIKKMLISSKKRKIININ